jgi:hypothetical protein
MRDQIHDAVDQPFDDGRITLPMPKTNLDHVRFALGYRALYGGGMSMNLPRFACRRYDSPPPARSVK